MGTGRVKQSAELASFRVRGPASLAAPAGKGFAERRSNIGDFMTRDELNLLEKYLRKTFQTESIEIRLRPKKKDSAEVYVADEFVGVIYRDDEDGEVSYQFQMAILELDLA